MAGRNISAAGLAYLENSSSLRFAHLVALELPRQASDQPKTYAYISDAGFPITFKGKIYEPGKIIKVGAVQQTKDLSSYKLTVEVAGEFQEELERALLDEGYSYLNKKLTILKAVIDADGALVNLDKTDGGPLKLFEGFITDISINESITGSSTVRWSCANHFHDFEQVQGRRTDPQDHNASPKNSTYALDQGFKHGLGAINVLAEYQVTEKRYKMKKGGWALNRTYKMVEYDVEVTKEVDLSVNLSAKFLPVVYGVQKVAAIPIFADTLFHDPSKLYLAYAICEGEIEGVLNLFIDGKPVVCYSKDHYDKEDTICAGSQQLGDTINVWMSEPNYVGPDGQPIWTGPSLPGAKYPIQDAKGEMTFWFYHGTPNQHYKRSLFAADSPEYKLGLQDDTVNPIDQHILYKIAHAEKTPDANGNMKRRNFYRQSEDSNGDDYWGPSAWLADTAYMVVEVTLDGEGRTDVPEIEVVVKGKKVNIYSAPGTYTSNKTSSNPVWQALDYLSSTRYGPGVPISEINLDSALSVAAIYDREEFPNWSAAWQNYYVYVGWDNQAETNTKLMQMNTILPTENTVFKNCEALLGQCDMSLNWDGGLYAFSIDSDKAPRYSIGIGDIIGSINFQDKTTKDKWNTISASIVDPGDAWNNKQITFYEKKYLEEDNGVEKKGNIAFPFITNYYTARSWAERTLRKSRKNRTISFKLHYKYYDLVINDILAISYGRFGWVEKKFLVQDISIEPDGSIDITAQEFTLDAYYPTEQNPGPSPELPDDQARPIRPLNLKLDFTNVDLAIDPTLQAELTWTYPLGKNVVYFLVWWTGSSFSEVEHTVLYSSSIDTYSFPLRRIGEGNYSFNVVAVDSSGMRSYTSTVTSNIGSAADVLSKVQDFRIDPSIVDPSDHTVWYGKDFRMQWTPLEDKTISLGVIKPTMYELRVFDDTTGDLVDTLQIPLGTTNNFNWTYAHNRAAYLAKNGRAGFYRDIKAGILGFGKVAGFPTEYHSREWSYIE